MTDLTKPSLPLARSTRQRRRDEIRSIHEEMTLEDERAIIRACIQKAAAGSVKHAEFLFNRKYGLPTAKAEIDTVQRVVIVTSDNNFGGVSDADRAYNLRPLEDTEEGDYLIEDSPEEDPDLERLRMVDGLRVGA